jgi:dTDP-4-dehydrorhamnose reductase
MKKILITGAKGQLGQALLKIFNKCTNYILIETDAEDLDISNLERVISYVKETSPHYIINCAAYTAVDLCETEVEQAYKINAIGPRNLAIAAEMCGSTLIHISTDYVFDGLGIKDEEGQVRPYIEFDTPNPQSVYGKTKWEGEKFVQTMSNRFFIIRTAWLYGEGNNFVRTMMNLAQTKDYLKVVNDQFGTPTSTTELAKMIKHLMDHNEYQYGIYHGTCEGSCSWYDLTKEIFRIKGYTTSVDPCTTEEFPRPAKRPQYSILRNYMLELNSEYKFSHWKEALEEYLMNEGE